MRRPDILVIGGTGLLGSSLVATATARGLRTAATHYRRPDPVDSEASWHRCNLSVPGAVDQLIRSLQPTSVINAAYVQRGRHLTAVTADAPGEMALACAAVNARFVHISSDVVFDGDTDRAYVEADEPAPVHDYGRAKARSEMLVAVGNPTAVVVRTSLLWGRENPGPQGLLVSDPEITFFTDELRCPLRVDHLAATCLELTDRSDIIGLLHVAGADAVDRLGFARLLAPLVGVDPGSLRGRACGRQPGRPLDCRLDSGLARSLLSTPLPGAFADLSPEADGQEDG